MPAVIVIGDKTSHGGTVVGCAAAADTCGKGIARVGDLVTCPIKGHGTNPIVSGDMTFLIDGQAVARHGDKTACGATLIASQWVTTDDPGRGSTNYSNAPSAANSAAIAAPSSAPADSALATDDHTYDMHWLLKDKDTGTPAANVPYRITMADGRSFTGVTDSDGLTEKVGDSHASVATIEAPYYDDNTNDSNANDQHDTCTC